jgi:RHS repeat-associated protein
VVISDTEAVYLYGLDIIAQQQSERLYYVHDGLGSVRQLLDTTGQIETNYTYDPFGVPLSGGEVYNPYQYTGEAWDAEVELLYLRARYYQPEVGRFITKDPWEGDVRRPGTLNGYVYVDSDPVNHRDPSGLQGDGPVPNPWLPAPPQPHIVSRSEWHALEPGMYTIGCRVVAGYAERIYDPLRNKGGYAYYSQLYPGRSLADILHTIVIHHEGNVEFYSVHMVQLSHMVRKGYLDIGYHYVVGTWGTIYEGRRIDVRGAHVAEQNSGMIGVLLLGDFEPGYVTRWGTYPIDWIDDPGPTGDQVLSTIALVRWLDYLYGIDSVKGHREVEGQESVCPGERLMRFIPIFNAVAQER